MSETNQQRQGAAPPKLGARKNDELFWRIIAGLMLVIIGWIVWVLYQISPRSLITPLVYESQAKPMGTPAAAAAASPRPPPAPPAALPSTQIAPDAAAAALAMDQAQAAARSGAHQASADVQAETLEKRQEAVQGARLKLSTEITTPLAEKKWIPQQQEGKADGASTVPAATDAAGKARP